MDDKFKNVAYSHKSDPKFIELPFDENKGNVADAECYLSKVTGW